MLSEEPIEAADHSPVLKDCGVALLGVRTLQSAAQAVWSKLSEETKLKNRC